MSRYLKTSEIARIVGVHPNTVRLYEAKGYLPLVPRNKAGYRLFTPRHLDHLRLAQLALSLPIAAFQKERIELVQCAVDDPDRAMQLAEAHLHHVRLERTRAEAAAEFLERWAHGQVLDTANRTLSIGQTAIHLGVTADQLRNWDRSGLLDVPRDPETGYRLYGAAEIGRLRVIRMLRQSGYSLMAILRMLRRFDAGEIDGLREALDTPGDHEAVETVADRWLTTLAEQEQRAQAIIRQIAAMIAAGAWHSTP
ncbi:MAG: MerR family transcriptional regulator [Anaerolineae bacterium]|nr:MerR family transcriptional regulator [Anaerolineae bacterium]